MTSPRYGSLAARTECNHCGAFLPLDAPLLEVSCPQCTEQVSVPASLWGAMLDDLDEQIDELAEGKGHTVNTVIGAQKLVYEIKRQLPQCEKCNALFAIADFPVGASQNFTCAQCGDPASTEPAPDWLVQVAPNAKQLYRVDPDPELAGSGAVALTPDAAPRPVALACPSCGGGLEITVDHPRLTPCRFCGADVYLPDAVWRKLHPVKVVTPFYVRFEGPTQRARQEMERARQAKMRAAKLARQAEKRAAQLARQAEKRAAELEREAQADQRISPTRRWAWTTSLLTGAAAAALIVFGWSPVFGFHSLQPDSTAYAMGMGTLALVMLSAAIVAIGAGSRLIALHHGKDYGWLTNFVGILAVPLGGGGLALVLAFFLLRGNGGDAIKHRNGAIDTGNAARPLAFVCVVLGLVNVLLSVLVFRLVFL